MFEPEKFRNYYKCVCAEEWSSTWSCMCDERCSRCNREVMPRHSDELCLECGEIVDDAVNNVCQECGTRVKDYAELQRELAA